MGQEPSYAISLDSSDQILDVLRYLASQCPPQSDACNQVTADTERWAQMTDVERREAFARDLKRVCSLCPWVKQKGRVVAASEVLCMTIES